MNTRLQVEHPVTELVTGVDLVQLQLDVASGEELPFDQSEIVPTGWAMEFRVTAEDPFANFAPSAGPILYMRAPEGPGVRHDSGVVSGSVVTPHYDPLIAKLVIAGDDRRQVLERARRAVREYRIDGIATTLPFFNRMLHDERFVAGDMDIAFVDRHWMSEMATAPFARRDELLPAALAAAAVAKEAPAASSEKSSAGSGSRWTLLARRDQLGGGV